MQAKLIWQQKMQFEGISQSGHKITIDGDPKVFGNNNGMRPMEMLLLSLVSCSAMDIVFILKKAGEDISSFNIEVEGKRVDTIPKIFSDIHIKYVISGKDLSKNKTQNAINLSAEKYCSVSNMLKEKCNITYSFEIKSFA